MSVKLYDNLFLPAGDLEQAQAFYAEMLGLPVTFRLEQQGLIAFQVGDEEPALFLRTRLTKPAIWFEVPDVHAAHAALRARGQRFLSEPVEVHTGLAVEFPSAIGWVSPTIVRCRSIHERGRFEENH